MPAAPVQRVRVPLARDFGLAEAAWRRAPAVLEDADDNNTFVLGWVVARKLRRCPSCPALSLLCAYPCDVIDVEEDAKVPVWRFVLSMLCCCCCCCCGNARRRRYVFDPLFVDEEVGQEHLPHLAKRVCEDFVPPPAFVGNRVDLFESCRDAGCPLHGGGGGGAIDPAVDVEVAGEPTTPAPRCAYGDRRHKHLSYLNRYRYILIGASKTGTNVHTDNGGSSAWLSLLCGRKRWTFWPPDTPGTALQQGTWADSREWYRKAYPEVAAAGLPGQLEVVQRPGETMWVPTGWWHVVENIGFTVALTQNIGLAPTPVERAALRVAFEAYDPNSARIWWASLAST